MMQQQMAAMNPAMGGGGAMGMGGTGQEDYDKLFKGEAENLEVLEHSWVGEGIEQRVLAKFAVDSR